MSDPNVPTTPPKTKSVDWGAQVRQIWGDEWHKDDVVYKFSNGREFKSSDDSSSGIYDGS